MAVSVQALRRAHDGQRNYRGCLWTATTGSLIGYEALLERDRVCLADFDPSVRWIASQPFWVLSKEHPHGRSATGRSSRLDRSGRPASDWWTRPVSEPR